MAAIYDLIGLDYAQLRRPDVRIAARIANALGDAETVLNVGAGAGSYEPVGKCVTAIEPSVEMIRQRPVGNANLVQGQAESLPFEDQAFDASMAVLTLHHWSDKGIGLSEMRRVTRGNVILLTFDPACRNAWLLDYFPELAELDEAQMPEIADYEDWLGPVLIEPVPIPHDCTDGFLHSWWRRPSAYLDPEVRAAISSFWKIGGVETGLQQLRADLESGAWERRYGRFLELSDCDLGYRLVVSQE